jgi:hypothetical protein
MATIQLTDMQQHFAPRILKAAMDFYRAQGREDLSELKGTQSMSAPIEYMELLWLCEELFELETAPQPDAPAVQP